jgi:hypothetical protein
MPAQRKTAANAISGGRPGPDEAEAALVEHYPGLVRLAYLTLPPALGRHRRVLAAHSVVQRVLPWSRGGKVPPGVPGQRGTAGAAHAWIRARVLRAALAHGEGPGGWRRRIPHPRPPLPLVMGLRFFPRAGGTEELALDQALSAVPAAARAALALLVLEELPGHTVRRLLAEAGANDPAAALRTAERLAADRDGRAGILLSGAEFDPCTVQTRPTDLLRRRQRGRITAAAVAIALAGGVLALVLPGQVPAPEPAGPAGPRPVSGTALARTLDPAALERAPAEAWADTSRVDFSAWPPRGSRTGDTPLLKRALYAWGGPGRSARTSASADTGTAPPVQPPRLLYAGEVDGAAVVLLHDGQRVVRYAEALSRRGTPALDFARDCR